MEEYYLINKALHVVGVICWMAGLLYLVRLYVYHTEAFLKPASERSILHQQFSIMERKLMLGITLPAALLSLITGIILIVQINAFKQPWFHMKALLVVLLLAYTHFCGKWRKALAAEKTTYTSKYFRIQNEVSTLLMVGIVFSVITKESRVALIAMLGFLAFGFVIFKAFSKKKT